MKLSQWFLLFGATLILGLGTLRWWLKAYPPKPTPAVVTNSNRVISGVISSSPYPKPGDLWWFHNGSTQYPGGITNLIIAVNNGMVIGFDVHVRMTNVFPVQYYLDAFHGLK